MAFFPRSSGGFAPLFHLLDDYEVHRSKAPKCKATPVRSFSPRFDIYEQDGSYHLDGELPGVDQSNIDIEFTDPHTLVIKGRVERQYNETVSEANEGVDEPADDTSSNRSLQPTVEDEDETTVSATPESPASTSHSTTASGKSSSPYKYWAAERSLGQFHRTFSFPTRVDQEAVKASLRNGILSVVVPKEAAPKLKKIRIE